MVGTLQHERNGGMKLEIVSQYKYLGVIFFFLQG